MLAPQTPKPDPFRLPFFRRGFGGAPQERRHGGEKRWGGDLPTQGQNVNVLVSV